MKNERSTHRVFVHDDAVSVMQHQSFLDLGHIDHRIGVVNHSCGHHTLLFPCRARAKHLVQVLSVRFYVLDDDATASHAAQRLGQLFAVGRVAGHQELDRPGATLGWVDSDCRRGEAHGHSQVEGARRQNEDVGVGFLLLRRLSFGALHQRFTKHQLSGDFIEMKFVLVVAMNDLIAHDVVRLFGIHVRRFDERRDREVLEVWCQNELVERLFESRRLVIDIE